jgi:hypothetical protein
MHPKHILETFRPVFPKRTYSILLKSGSTYFLRAHFKGAAQEADPTKNEKRAMPLTT